MNHEEYEAYFASMEKWAVEELGMAPYTNEEFEMDVLGIWFNKEELV